jgi:ATP-dependent DNA helicase DinG
MIAPLDLAAASRLFVDQEMDGGELGTIQESTSPDRPLVSLDPDAIARDLGPDGPVATLMQQYEDRTSQRNMAAAIATLYNDGGIGLLEAGTGVGKSLGYLMPALRWAAANRQRTVVSTNTINLQEQLVHKDLPFLERALSGEHPVRFALLKGWRNYLCRLRLAQTTLLGPALLEDNVTQAIEQIVEWAETTDEGSLSSLPTQPRAELWDEISAEPDLCTRNACPHFQDCFVFKARRRAAQADVVVVNHHLLMSDVAVRRAQGNWGDVAVIPPYTRVVIDEGHHLEDAASAHLGTTTTRRTLHRLFARLDRRGRGLIAALVERLSAKQDLLGVASLDVVNQRIIPSVRAVRDKCDLVFDLLLALLRQSGQGVLRLTDGFVEHPVWKSGLHIALTDLLRELQHLSDSLTLVRERLESSSQRDETLASLINELRGVARRLLGSADALRVGLRPPVASEPSVRWIEVKGREGNVGVTSVPLDLAPILRDDLFRKVKTAIVTSATLVADGQFNFLSHRLGLGDGTLEPVTAVFPSPFDYPAQAVLALPTDIDAPNLSPDRHFESLLRIVQDVADASGGGVFVLFTSHSAVRAAAAALRTRGVDARFPLLVHGEESRDILLSEFKAAHNAILLGTASYWEGVDVPGAALRALVIARLPFRVPSEPVTAAHCEAIEARGGNAFAEYMIPHASLRLKQGFGRLIRSASDRGVIVLADPRVISKTYGRELIDGLPPAARVSGPWRVIIPQLRAFYGDNTENR